MAKFNGEDILFSPRITVDVEIADKADSIAVYKGESVTYKRLYVTTQAEYDEIYRSTIDQIGDNEDIYFCSDTGNLYMGETEYVDTKKLTQAEYDALVSAGTTYSTVTYFCTDTGNIYIGTTAYADNIICVSELPELGDYKNSLKYKNKIFRIHDISEERLCDYAVQFAGSEPEWAKIVDTNYGFETERTRNDKRYSNALKGSKSDSIIQIDDVSPTDQRLNVSLTSDTVTDFSSKTVSVYGKNFAKLKTGTSYGLTLEWLENEGCYLLNGTCTLAGSNSLFTNVSTICGVGGKAFTLKTKQISGSVKNADGKTKYAIFYTSTSEDNATGGSVNLIGANLNESVVTKTATASKDRLYNCRLYISEGVEFDNFKFTAQLEIGTTATDYEAYKEPVTYKSTKGGSVSGVTLGTGAYNLCTNDSAVDINCEYNRDINKAFEKLEEKLTNAILATGGNV